MNAREELAKVVRAHAQLTHETPDAIDRLMDRVIADAHVEGGVTALQTYAKSLENAVELVRGTPRENPIVTLDGVARALRLSAHRIRDAHDAGNLRVEPEPEPEPEPSICGALAEDSWGTEYSCTYPEHDGGLHSWSHKRENLAVTPETRSCLNCGEDIERPTPNDRWMHSATGFHGCNDGSRLGARA